MIRHLFLIAHNKTTESVFVANAKQDSPQFSKLLLDDRTFWLAPAIDGLRCSK